MKKVKKMTVLAVVIMGMFFTTLLMADGGESENLAKNGTFDEALKGWFSLKVKDKKTVKDEPFISVKKTKKGVNILVVKIDFADAGKFNTHNTGAVIGLKKRLPKNSKIKVSFKAKWIDGAKFLKIGRTWGGADATVELTDKAKEYSVELALPHPSSDLIFSLTDSDKKGQRLVVNGTFLLDNVKVEKIK